MSCRSCIAFVRSTLIGAVFVVAVMNVGGATHAADGVAKHVVVVGIDGLAPAGIVNANTPTFDRLCKEGAWSFHARAVMPTSSSSNWASMIMGAGPEQHGVTSNEWQRDKFTFSPVVKGPEGIYPTMFGVLRRARPDSVIGVFHDWDDFGRLVEGKSCDALENADGPVDAAHRAVAFWKARQPTLLFVHLDHVDHAGHSEGWGSPAYLRAVEEADRLIDQIMAAVAETKLQDETVLLVTADHGGINKGHGGETMSELEIPWILAGPGVRAGTELADPINTFDTAPTVLRALGVAAPAYWIGRAVEPAFK